MKAALSKTDSQQPRFGANGKLANLAGLAEATGLPEHTLRRLWQRQLIPGVKLGHRSIYFDPARVVSALASLERKSLLA